MKIFAILFVCALTYSVRGDSKQAALIAANECKEIHGATDDDVVSLFKLEPAASTNAKCMRSCTMKKFGFINEDGKMVKENMLKFLNGALKGDEAKLALADEMVSSCVGIDVSTDHCEAADEYIACIKKESETRGLKIFS